MNTGIQELVKATKQTGNYFLHPNGHNFIDRRKKEANRWGKKERRQYNAPLNGKITYYHLRNTKAPIPEGTYDPIKDSGMSRYKWLSRGQSL